MYNYNSNIILLLIFLLLFLIFYIIDFYIINNINDYYKKNIIRIPNFITNKECKQLIKIASPHMHKSLVIGPNTNIEDVGRTSTNTFLNKNNKLVNKIYNKLEKILKIPKANFEPPQIARYKPKQFYAPHYDIINDWYSDYFKRDIKRGGYRIKTAIIYLTDNFEQGSTSFPLLNKKFKLSVGEVLIFNNLYDKNKYYLSLHQGEPVKKGVKWILTVWIRQKTFK